MKLSLFPVSFNDRETYVDDQGQLTGYGVTFLRALFERTGAQNGVIPSIGQVAAAGTNQGEATALVDDWNEISGALNAGVIIPRLQPGQRIRVYNAGANTLRIYPWRDGTIDALAANAPYSLATLKMQVFTVWALNTIRSEQWG